MSKKIITIFFKESRKVLFFCAVSSGIHIRNESKFMKKGAGN